MAKFSQQEMLDMASRLENYDAVFSQLWQVGKPIYSNLTETAAVEFDPVGQCVQFHINERFWKTLTTVQKDFITCHEMLHVILEHGRRGQGSQQYDPISINKAMDVVVNELLVSSFGFNRQEFDPKNQFCWRDTVFPNAATVMPDQTFEYYLTHMPKPPQQSGGGKGKPQQQGQPGQSGGNGNQSQRGQSQGKPQSGKGKQPKLVDDHSRLNSEDTSQLAERIMDRLSPEERERFKQRLGQEGEENSNAAGAEAGGFVKQMEKQFVAPKPKWEAVIKKCLKTMIDDGPEEVWFGTDRRYCAMGKKKAILPVEQDGEAKAQKRALVYFFLDTSGSCAHLAKRFWKLALSIPQKKFDIRLRCFDTRVYEVNFKDRKLYGFGGTSFQPMERHIQAELAKNPQPYPDGVFVITDGQAYDQLRPEKPERWHVLLTGNYKRCLPKEAKTYDLRQFE